MAHAQLKLRITDDLRAKAEAAARANKTSLNAELINRLENSFSPELRLVRGELTANIITYKGKLLLLIDSGDSPQPEPIELNVRDDELAEILSYFEMVPTEA